MRTSFWCYIEERSPSSVLVSNCFTSYVSTDISINCRSRKDWRRASCKPSLPIAGRQNGYLEAGCGLSRADSLARLPFSTAFWLVLFAQVFGVLLKVFAHVFGGLIHLFAGALHG